MSGQPLRVLWLQSGGCGGCSLSALCAGGAGLFRTLKGSGVEFVWHPSFSEASGSEMLSIIEACADGSQPFDVLCLEGAMMRGPNGSGRFHLLSGSGEPMIRWVERLAEKARYTLAVGNCAAYGGIPMAGGNPTECCGVQYEGHEPGGLLGEGYQSGAGLPVINIAGCPIHPDWLTETLALIAADEFDLDAIDDYGRPRFYADHQVHHGCPRNEFYEFKASAKKPADQGCLMENLGCIGTQAHADCNLRLWNGTGSCLRGGYACINCTGPEFEEPGHPFITTPKIAGIPLGLPTDMPKAWFVALASLSKAATPKRVRMNAESDHDVVPPTLHKERRK